MNPLIRARNTHAALPLAIARLMREGFIRHSRAGEVLEFPAPMMVKLDRPFERCVFYEERDWPVVFFLMESLWMLAGRKDVEWLAAFNPRMREYSDDGRTFHGAYGYRWRHSFAFDQLSLIIKLLQNHPNTRRAILQMWDAGLDLREHENDKDLPCNSLISFLIKEYDGEEKLDMTVFNRSNDLFFGALGANPVHFSVLHEYVAASICRPMGSYYVMTNNLHAYRDVLARYEKLAIYEPDPFRTSPRCPYEADDTEAMPVVTDAKGFLHDCECFCENIEHGRFNRTDYHNEFFSNIAHPVHKAWWVWKQNRQSPQMARVFSRKHIDEMPECDWKVAMDGWLERRYEKAVGYK